MMITLYKTDDKGEIRYYSIHDRQGHLFSPYTFSVHWGPGLSVGREKSYVFETRREMDTKLQELIQGRVDDGYRVLYSFFRNRDYEHLRPALSRASVS